MEFRLDTLVDISGASTLKVLVKKPSYAEVEWTNCEVYDTTCVKYVTVSGDLDEIGHYTLQPYVEWGSTSKHRGEAVKVRVYKKFA